jgi:hypothetical protein
MSTAMRRVRRILSQTAIALSLLLSLGSIVLWAMTWDGYVFGLRQWLVENPSWARSRFVSVLASKGGVSVAIGSNWWSQEFIAVAGTSHANRGFPLSFGRNQNYYPYPSDGFGNLVGVRQYVKGAGFAWVRTEAGPPPTPPAPQQTAPRLGTDAVYLVAPLWFLTTVFGVCPVAALVRWRQRRRAKGRKGLCRRCGYDLRASPDRCPECGMPLPSPSPVPA